ncbi:MAG: TnpV protein [Clostridia bacterium]|nr:TnpV protein [Clostridia bacterium]
MTELTYRQEGDYLIPNIELPENKPIGKYGMLRQTFLKKERNYLYTTMLMEGTLNEHLWEIDQTAKQQVEQMVQKMAQTEGVNEELKAKDPMKWTGLMNNLLHSAEEVVLNQLIYS